MDNQVLVAYATKYGATTEIAEKIGQVLRQAGLRTDVLPANRVSNLNPLQGSGPGQRGLHRPMAQGGNDVLEGQREGAG